MENKEFSLIKTAFFTGLQQDSTHVANGDDASVHGVETGMDVVVSTDTSLAGVHWPHDFPLLQAADRAVCSALSDLAAMGAKARWCWLSAMLPDASYGLDMGRGVHQALARHQVELAGGDTVQAKQCGLNVTVAGVVSHGQSMCRNQAKVGDDVWLFGKLGYAALGLLEWQAGRRDGVAVEAFSQIEPLLNVGSKLRQQGVRCCIDVSDGLLQDAGHICHASAVGMQCELSCFPYWQTMLAAHGLDETMRLMLSGGEDYALLCTAKPCLRQQLQISGARIGVVVAGSGVQLRLHDEDVSFSEAGFGHFV